MTDLDAVERTALLTAALRAAETRRTDRLYADPYAELLAGATGPDLLAEIRAVTFPANAPRTLPSTPDYNAIRTRFFDDYLCRAVRDPAMRQVVLAPVGMDTRSYRLDWPDHVTVFELDRPAVLAARRAALDPLESTVDRVELAADLTTDAWHDELLASGYSPSLPSTWLLEGLLYYIPEPDVHRILDGVRVLTAPGSNVAADIVNADALNLRSMRGLLDVFAGWGCPWLFGTNDPERLFAQHGMRMRAVQPGDAEADFGRWPDPVPPREQAGVRRVFFTHGRRGA
jgi:methyltransferase (TIGR00027 family)